MERFPLFGAVYKRICVLVDRESSKSKARVYQLCAEKINLGRSMVIFPEGGVFENEWVLNPFKEGAFAIAKQAQIPIAVYTFIGLEESFPFQFWKGKPKKIEVYLEKIISAEEVQVKSKTELKNQAYDLILNRLQQF